MSTENPQPPRLTSKLPIIGKFIVGLFAVGGVSVAATYYYLNLQHQHAEAAKADALRLSRANIFFTGSPPEGWCSVDVKENNDDNCDMRVSSTEEAKKIRNLIVQYPTAATKDNTGFSTSALGGAINIDGVHDYLVKRADQFISSGSRQPILVPLPIIIYSTYEFEGELYNDRSLYYLMYGVVGVKPRLRAIPVDLINCGRLSGEDPKVDFIVDPWMVSLVGYSTEPSRSIMFGCPGGYAAWIESDTGGRFRVESDVAPGMPKSPKGKSSGYQLSPTGMRLQSAEARPLQVKYRYQLVGDAGFLALPKPAR